MNPLTVGDIEGGFLVRFYLYIHNSWTPAMTARLSLMLVNSREPDFFFDTLVSTEHPSVTHNPATPLYHALPIFAHCNRPSN